MTNIYNGTRCKSVADFQSLLTRSLALAVVVLLTAIASFGARAQNPNLVPNSSFRNYYTLPTPTELNTFITPHTPNNRLGLHWVVRRNENRFKPYFEDSLDPNHIYDWFRANQATPDYYHIFSPGSYIPFDSVSPNAGVGVPHNWGQDSTHPLYPVSVADSAYAGIFIERYPASVSDSIYGTGYYDWHEYLAVKLNDHLETGTYLVKFHYAIAEYENTYDKPNGNKALYYLKNLGVAFAPNSLFLDYYLPPPLLSRSTWYEEGSGPTFNTLPMAVNTGTNYVESHNLPYANPGTWETFESYFVCDDTSLQYIILGNFQQRIALDDIGLTPLDIIDDNRNIDDSNHYFFYFFVDSVEVRKVEDGDCKCETLFTCPHTRNVPLQDSSAHPNTCCFTTPIIPAQTSCAFWSVRIKIDDSIVSDPPTKDFGRYIKFGDTVTTSFCIEKTTGEERVLIQYEFLDSTGAVVCAKTEWAQCNCNCFLAASSIAPGVPLKVLDHTLTKVANDSSKCCWEYSLKNNYSCSYLNDYKLEIDIYDGGATIQALPGWSDSIVGTTHIFSSMAGLKYNTTSKVFKICTEAQSSGTIPPKIIGIFKKNGSGTLCRRFVDSLVCRESDICCDKLSIELRRGSAASSSECRFDLIVKHLNSLSKCDVYGIRVKTLGGQLLHSTTTGTILNLDKPTIIWSSGLGPCAFSYGSGYSVTATYVIEILGPNDSVKCSVQKSFSCCPRTTPIASGKAVVQDEKPILLTTGGLLTYATIEAGTLRYSLTNNGDATPATIRLLALSGDVLFQQETNLAKGSSSIGEIDVSQLASGSYYVIVQTDSWLTSRQVIIVR